MAKRVDELPLVQGRMVNFGKRRLAFAGFPEGDEVKAVIGNGVIKLYPANAKLCTACGELVELSPTPATPDYCPDCIARIAAQVTETSE